MGRCRLILLLSYFGIALVAVGVVGFVLKTVEFVRVTIPENHGLNPGFGAFEMMALPAWAAGSIGVGILTSWKVGVACVVVGFLTLGFLAQLLGYLFGGSEPGSRNDAP